MEAPLPPNVILDTPGGGDQDSDDDDDQFVVEDSAPLVPPTDEAFIKTGDPMMNEKPEGKLIEIFKLQVHRHCYTKT